MRRGTGDSADPPIDQPGYGRSTPKNGLGTSDLPWAVNERIIANALTDNGTRATLPYSRHVGQLKISNPCQLSADSASRKNGTVNLTSKALAYDF
jgi:hypothetical protein